MTRSAFCGVLPASSRQVQRLSLIQPADPTEDTPVDTTEPADAEVCALDEVTPVGGFVLLGESGMGKTTALAQLRAVWEATGSFEHVVDVNLELVRDAATFDMLITSELKQYFQNVAASDEDIASRARPRVLLMLDHVDRCALGSLLFGKLMERLASAPETRGFTLLAACRDTDWPVELTKQLRQVMPRLEGARLLPLRRCDVAALAESSHLDPEDFLTAVDTAGVWPLAEIPVSAMLLIRLFRNDATLPSEPASLYEKGLCALVEDPDSSRTTRPDSRRSAGLSAPRRMAVAARIAAWLQLCGYYAVSTARIAEATKADLPWWETVGGSEPATGGELSIGEDHVIEVLDCGVFTSARPNQRTVRHESFTAFLTARYLHQRKFTEKQLRTLLLASERAGAKVHPLLRESAAWLVALDPVTQRWLAEADAETVASFPYALADTSIRPVLVDALLDLADSDLLRNRDFSGLKIDRLGHPELAAQLRTALATRSMLRGRAAATLAEECGVHEVHEDLLAAACDETCDPALRVRTILAASALDRTATAEHLRPLIIDPAAELSNELRGALLDATWPEALSATELVAALGPVTQPTVFDLYTLFLHRLHERLEDEHLPELLLWAAGRSMTGNGLTVRQGARRTAELCDKLITRAWAVNDRAPLLPALAELVLERLSEDLYLEAAEPLETASPTDMEDRLTLVRLLVQRAEGTASIPRLATSPLSRRLRLITSDDLPWLLEQEATADAPFIPRWQVLIRIYFNADDPQHRLAARQVAGSRVWQAVLTPVLETDQNEPPAQSQPPANAADIDDVQTEDLPERASRRQEIINGLTTGFARAQSGDLDAFWQLCRHMHFDPDSRMESSWWSDNLSDRPGYRVLHALYGDLDSRFETLARTYLRGHHPHTEEWIDQPDIVSWPAHCGYLAFAFLERRSAACLDALEDSVWAAWAPALLAFDAFSESAESADRPERKHRLLKQLSLHAPDAAVEPFRRILHMAWDSGQIANELRFVESCWSPALADALAEDLPSLAEAAPQQNFDNALGLLLEHDHAGATIYAQKTMRDGASESAQALGRRAALMLLCTRPATAFPEVFDQMRWRPAWGRTVAAGLARVHTATDPLSRLEDAQLGALYRWLLEQYPPESDSFEPGFHFTSVEQDTRFWRERAARHLMERGTLATIDELAALADDNPHRPWIRRMLATAQERYRAISWSPPHLSDVRAMAQDAGRRYARDENDLREAVLEQLGHLQERMRGKTPEAYFLWNEHRVSTTNSLWRPKYEPEISDYVAVHLGTHLRHVFTNREVEVDRTTSTGIGERVDLLCEAFDPADRDQAERFQIVIEVKGCWNKDLLTDLHDQLSADYMPKVGTRHGIYLVGYFPKAQWEPDDRYKKTPDRTAEQLKAQLEPIAQREFTQTRNTVSPFVLDMSRPEPRRRAASKPPKR